MVNEQGQRVVNEDAYTGTIGLAIAKQPNAAAWLMPNMVGFFLDARAAL